MKKLVLIAKIATTKEEELEQGLRNAFPELKEMVSDYLKEMKEKGGEDFILSFTDVRELVQDFNLYKKQHEK